MTRSAPAMPVDSLELESTAANTRNSPTIVSTDARAR